MRVEKVLNVFSFCVLMEVVKFVVGPIETNCFLCVEGNNCVLIDGGDDNVIKYIKERKLKLTKILLTHGHGDHLIDVTKIKKMFNAKVYIHSKDNVMLQHPFNLSICDTEGVVADGFLEGEIGCFKVLYTPGHTLGGVCFYNEKEKLLFAGDTLFKGAFGRVDLPYSDSALMAKSLAQLIKLPVDVKVYPGHGDSTTIGEEVSNVEHYLKSYFKVL